MLASHNWLAELTGLTLDPAQVASRLTAAGLEVEGLQTLGGQCEGVVLAEVRGLRPHPARENLRLVDVFDGTQQHEVVCGAANVPAPGGLVALARLGARLPGGLTIEERKLGGVTSRGMLCSETELAIGSAGEGILVIEPGPGRAPGGALADALGLRDTIYTIGLTPNRPDCLGHVGIARELAAIWQVPFAPPQRAIARQLAPGSGLVPEGEALLRLAGAGAEPTQLTAAGAGLTSQSGPFQIAVAAPERCPRYGAAIVLGVQIAPAPFAVRYRLHSLGVRPINNVVDATNLILLGWGHPIHAFDLERLRGRRIEVRLAAEGETIQTLDGVTRSLNGDDLLIGDGEGPVALAGVMGGGNSEIHDATRHVLIECAYFDPRSVRRTSKRLGLHTDASHRFERGVDPEAVPAVLADAAASIAALGGGAAVPEAFDVKGTLPSPKHVSFRASRAAAILGAPIELGEAEAIFGRLGCRVERGEALLEVGLPSFRPDLTREIDLIEEYARMRGYDTLPTILPRVRPSSEPPAAELAFVRKLREVAVAVGLCESINYAFVSPDDLIRTRSAGAAPRLANPLSEERSVLRTSLLPGLVRNLGLAQRHQQRRFAAFEVGRVFREQADAILPEEHYELGILLWGLRQNWYDEREQLDFYDLKGAVESVTSALLGEAAQALADETLAADAPFLHPRRSARVAIAGAAAGELGELHPDLVRAFDLLGRPLYATLDVSQLVHTSEQLPERKPSSLARFPAATRDLAVVVAESLSAGEVAETLRSVVPERVESVRLFDIYRGAPVPEGHKSLAFHVVYRDPEATLTDKRVDDVHARVSAAAEQRFGAALRR